MQQLHHLYINPLEKCNLACRICYTRKTAPILKEGEILDFVARYNKVWEVKMITFCGGEVFTLVYFPSLVNALVKRGIFIQIITNGTIDKLEQFEDPNKINLIISLDGPEAYHDLNRGSGSFKKSTALLAKAKKMGFHTEIFSIVTRQNLGQVGEFENTMKKMYEEIDITYHPRKPKEYLNIHPSSNIAGEVDGFDFLQPSEIKRLMLTKKTFPPRTLGCYQVALVSDGTLYGCCEGYEALGKTGDDIPSVIEKLKSRIGGPCEGCSQPDFMCGIKGIISSIKHE